MRIYLDNGELRAAADPQRFELPPVEQRRALVIGDLVKAIFLSDPPLPTVPGALTGERMWLEIIEVRADGNYLGRLDNEPVLFDIRPDSLFEVRPENVIQIYPRS